jgi:hypothetical protein
MDCSPPQSLTSTRCLTMCATCQSLVAGASTHMDCSAVARHALGVGLARCRWAAHYGHQPGQGKLQNCCTMVSIAAYAGVCAQLVSDAVKEYNDALARMLTENSFFDDEGQFDATERVSFLAFCLCDCAYSCVCQLCTTLNNLEAAQAFLDEFIEGILGANDTDDVLLRKNSTDEQSVRDLLGDTRQQLSERLTALVSNVADLMAVDVFSHIETVLYGRPSAGASSGEWSPNSLFTSAIALSTRPVGHIINLFTKRRSQIRSGDRSSSGDSISAGVFGPVVEYLDSNLSTLTEFFYERVFRITLEQLWKRSVSCMLLMIPHKHVSGRLFGPTEAGMCSVGLQVRSHSLPSSSSLCLLRSATPRT